MRRSLVMAVLATALLAPACDQTTGKVTPDAVVAAITGNCGIVVTIADVAALLAKEPITTTVAAVSKMVCDAFNQKKATLPTGPAAPKSGVLNVNGVDLNYTVK